MIKLEIPRTTFLVGFILGPLLEDNFRRAMQLSDGSYGIFLESALANMLWALALVLVIWITVQKQRARQRRFGCDAGERSRHDASLRAPASLIGIRSPARPPRRASRCPQRDPQGGPGRFPRR